MSVWGVLPAGAECEFRFPARKSWHRGRVVENGGALHWSVEVTEAFDDFTNEGAFYKHVPAGELFRGLYAEHVRPVGGWPA